MICPMNRCLLMCCLLVIGHLQASQQLEIKNVKIPSAVEAGEEYVILDCDYSIDTSKTKGLVVKWYFNTFDLVYQWIYGTEPQAVSPVSRYIDLKYKASSNPFTMYRAMKLKQPNIDLTGNYTCQISTFQDEASEKRSMIVYEIGQTEDFKLWHTTKNIPGNHDVDVTCQALGVFPKPFLNIMVEGVPDVLSPRPIITETEDGHYNIIFYLTLENDNLPDSVVINCILDIPIINYNAKKTVVYYPRGYSSAQMWMNSFGFVFSIAVAVIIHYDNTAN